MAKINASWIQTHPEQFSVDEYQRLNLKYNNINFTIDPATGLSLNDLGVKLRHIDFGTVGPNQIDAADIPINDTDNLFSIDTVESALAQLGSKMILYRHTIPAFNNLVPVSVNGQYVSTVLDPLIKTISGHNNGRGDSTTPGVVLDTTRPYQIPLRRHNTQSAISTPEGYEVYARLTYDTDSNQYLVTYYFMDDNGTEQHYTGFTTNDRIDFAYVYFSQRFIDLPWASVFIDSSWQNIADIVSNVSDDNVDVDGMQYLLAGATTQAAVNSILDLLGHQDSSHGAALIKYASNATIPVPYNNVKSALDGIFSLLGSSSTSSTNYTENNVVSDTDTIVQAIDKLDLKFGDLASTNVGEGASLVGINDAGNYFSSTTVEGALQELAQSKRNLRTEYILLSLTDINNGYKQLPFMCHARSVSNNMLTLDFVTLDCVRGSFALDTEFKIMRNDSGTADYIVWKNNITPPGCSHSSSGIDSTNFGNLLIAGDILRLGVTV